MGCIAIQGDDTSGVCNTLLNQALTNAAANCVNGEQTNNLHPPISNVACSPNA